MPPPDSAQPPCHRNTQLPLAEQRCCPTGDALSLAEVGLSMSKPPNASGNPTKKKPMKPSPKMAKFVLTTCAACLARQKPVSTSAKPACMKMTRIAPMTTHSMLRLPATAATGSASWANATPPPNSVTNAAPDGSSERVLQHTFPTHVLSLVRGPWTWSARPGRSVRTVERVSVSAAAQRVFRLCCVLARRRRDQRRQERISRGAAGAVGAAGERRSTRAIARVVELAAEPIGQREAVDELGRRRS